VRFLAQPLARSIPDDAQPAEPISLAAAAEKKPKPRAGLGGPRRRRQFAAKRLGEIAEAFFLAKAADLGFTVLKPWGDSEAYDFVVDAHRGARGLSRVQVKSAYTEHPLTGYNISAHDVAQHPYSPHDVDAFIAYVVRENAWYVIPIRELRVLNLHLIPTPKGNRRSKWEKYREAWWHLDRRRPK
jgi:hypothetical protein